MKGKKTFFEILRFFMVGGTALIIHYVGYILLLHTLSENIAFTFAYIISFCFNFILSSYFTFKVNPTWVKFVKFTGSHIVNYLIQMFMFNIVLLLNLPSILAPIPVYALSFPINFILVRISLISKKNHE